MIENGALEHHFAAPLLQIDGLMAKTYVLIPVFVRCWSNFCQFLRLDQQKTCLDDDFVAILVNMCASIIENGRLEHDFVYPLVKIDGFMAKKRVLKQVFVSCWSRFF